MQTKFIAAAAVATSAAALKLGTPSTNVLAQTQEKALTSGIDTECHGTYAYQCMQTKVDKTLGALTDGVSQKRDERVKAANDFREESVEALQDLISNLRWSLQTQRKESELTVRTVMKTALGKIEDTLKALTADLELQAAGDSVIAIERQRVEGLIKDVYYADEQQYADQGREGKKAAIRALVQEFAEKVFPVFGERELEIMQDTVQRNVDTICDTVIAELDRWDAAVQDARSQMDIQMSLARQSLFFLNQEQQASMNARLAELTDDFLKIFWETMEEIYQTVSYSERQGVMWKALYQKDAFIAGVTAIRDEMVAALNANAEQMAAELQAERVEMEQWISENTSAMTATLYEMKGNVLRAGGEAMDELRETVLRLGEGKAQADEVSNLKAFIYDLAAIRFNPNVNGKAHGDGVQPYGKWVANRIE